MTATQYCTLVKIVREDSTIIGLTDLNKDIVYDAITYQAANAYTLSNIDKTTTLSVNNGTITGLVVTDLSAADLRDGLFDNARIYLVLYDFENDVKVKDLGTGFLGQVTLGTQSYEAEYRSLEQLMQQTIGRKYLPTCDARLGDSRCKVVLAPYTVTGALTGVTDNSNIEDSGRSEVASYFDYGLLTFTSGVNNGLSREVKAFSSGAFELLFAFPYTPSIGDTYSVYAGCDYLKSTCISKFDNVINFRGFDIPGQDQLSKFGGH